MTADFTGRITFNPDCKPSVPQYMIKCPALEIAEEGSSNVRESLEDLTERITDKVSQEFRTNPRSVEIIGYSMSIKFRVTGPVNRSLAEFEQPYSATIRMGDGTEIPLEKLTKTADKVIEYAKRTGKTVDEVLQEAKARLDREKASKGAKS